MVVKNILKAKKSCLEKKMKRRFTATTKTIEQNRKKEGKKMHAKINTKNRRMGDFITVFVGIFG